MLLVVFVVVFLITKTNKEHCHMIQQILVRSYILPPIVGVMNHRICTKINLTLKLISKYTRNRNNILYVFKSYEYYSSNHMIYNFSCDIQRFNPFYGKIDIQV